MLKSQCAKLKSRLQESQLEGKRVRASVMILETEVEQLKGRLLQPARPEVAQVLLSSSLKERKRERERVKLSLLPSITLLVSRSQDDEFP